VSNWAAGSVTTGKLAAGAVTADAIRQGAISTQKDRGALLPQGLIAAGAIRCRKIQRFTQLSAITPTSGTGDRRVIRSADGKFRSTSMPKPSRSPV